jgi:membrane dipeptidase
MSRLVLMAASLAVLALASPSLAAAKAPAPSAAEVKARAIHERLLTLDTHLDTPANFSRPGWDIMDRHSLAADGSEIDYPRMVEGGLDGGFFAIFTPQGPLTQAADHAARDAALVRGVEIHEMVSKHADKFQLALKADDAAVIAAKGKRVVFVSMENGSPVEDDVSLLSSFYALGVRIAGPVHFKTNSLGDSATDKPQWGGLSPSGLAFVATANRLGMVVDASHASDQVLEQAIKASKTPVILTHSGCSAVFQHPRNIDDAHLKALADSGGVIQIYAFTSYLIDVPKNPEKQAAMEALMAKAGDRSKLTPEGLKAHMAERKAIEAKYPSPRAKFSDYMAQLDHALKVAGVDHVGIGLDFDGGGGIEGLEDASDYWKITEALLAEGYSEADLQKIWSGNVLRLLHAAEDYKSQSVIRSN